MGTFGWSIAKMRKKKQYLCYIIVSMQYNIKNNVFNRESSLLFKFFRFKIFHYLYSAKTKKSLFCSNGMRILPTRASFVTVVRSMVRGVDASN
jgi:hypothetical protein